MTIVLGSGLSHDGSSSLMVDGRIVSAIAKERITRKRHDGFNDNLSIAYCLEAAGLGWDQVDLFVENLTFNRHELNDDSLRGKRAIPHWIRRVAISHHLAHAYSALGPCPYEDDVAVIVVDGRGSSLNNCHDAAPVTLSGIVGNITPHMQEDYFEHASVYHYRAGILSPVLRCFSPFGSRIKNLDPHLRLRDSVGEFYARVARWVFGSDFHDGKLMGLAPFGQAGAFGGPAIDFAEGQFHADQLFLERLEPAWSGCFAVRPDLFQNYANVAYWAQRQLEQVLLKLFTWAKSRTGARYAAYAGGVALNCVANRILIERAGFEDIFIQPAAGDDGLALGCCYYGHQVTLGRGKAGPDSRSAFGRTYSDDRIFRALESLAPSDVTITRLADIASASAQKIAEGHTLAWFQGPSEFGPRALGQRSILADPRGTDTQLYINREIKHREDFRPFAPAVLLEESARFFDGDYASPHMIVTKMVRPEWRGQLNAVVHRDGTARVQTVEQTIDPLFYSLLTKFGEFTGIPILLNTSLNGRDMPIIEEPEQAVRFFETVGLHSMAIGNYLVTKSRTPPPLRVS